MLIRLLELPWSIPRPSISLPVFGDIWCARELQGMSVFYDPIMGDIEAKPCPQTQVTQPLKVFHTEFSSIS